MSEGSALLRLARHPAHPCGSPETSWEPDCPVARFVICTPGFVRCTPSPRRLHCCHTPPPPNHVLNPGQPRKHLLPAPWQRCHALPPPWAPTVSCSSVCSPETPAWPRTNRSAATLAPRVRFPFWRPGAKLGVSQTRRRCTTHPLPPSSTSGRRRLFCAFPVLGTRTLHYLPSDFVGAVHLPVWNVLCVFTCGPGPIPAPASAVFLLPFFLSGRMGHLFHRPVPLIALCSFVGSPFRSIRGGPEPQPLYGAKRGSGTLSTCRGKEVLLYL